jgi:hypothetical protein
MFRVNRMRSRQLQDALEKLTKSIREVEAVIETMRTEHDPLVSHIFITRRNYRNVNDTKGGKRREMNARLSFNTACELGFRGSLDE